MSAFREKQGKVVVVDSSGPGRTMMSEVVRTTMGMSDVEGRPNLEEVVRLLELEPVSWVLTPLGSDQTVNGMHLLRLCTQLPELRKTRISLLLEEGELYCLDAAFEYGLLSYHRKPFTKDSLKEELTRLSQTLASFDYNETLTSADYLRRELQKVKDGHVRELSLARGLMSTFPGNSQVLLSMADPQFRAGQKDAAKRSLSSVKLIDPNLADRADEVGRQLFGDSFKVPVAGGVDAGDMNFLGADTALVVDPDEAVGLGVADILKKLGVKNVHHLADGEVAANWLKDNKEPQLVIMEWRIPSLSATALLQRIRAQGLVGLPIVILSSLLKPSDMPIVREMGVASIVAKPVNKDLFVPSLIGVMQQERSPTEAGVLERKFRLLIEGGKIDEAAAIRAKILEIKDFPEGKRKLVEAEWAFAKGNFTAARDLGSEALKMSGDSYIVLNLLGKTFMRLANYKGALKCFQKAQDLSPNNLERLCHIAETHAELGNDEAAKEAMDKASNLDPDSKVVKEGSAKLALASGDQEAAKKAMAALSPIDGVVAYMNNKAVAHAKCGMSEEAIGIYKGTLDSIPDPEKDTRSVVQYNLALAFARHGDLAKAQAECEGVLAQNPGAKVAKKAKSLAARLEKAIKGGTEFKLISAEPIATGAAPAAGGTGAPSANGEHKEDENIDHEAKIEVKRGDICCFLIYNPSQMDSRVEPLFAKPPRFQRRDAIERAETMGNDRVGKSA